jgi:intracellular multiplication protein IcmP
MVYLTIKLWELKIITLFYPSTTFVQYIDLIEKTPLKEWTLKDMTVVGRSVGLIANLPIIAVLGFFAHKIWKNNPMQKFRRILTMQTLKESEQKIWPYIAPVVNIDLMKEPFDKGPYAMALRPYDFAVKHKLLLDERNVNSLDKVRSEKLFVSQLGKLYGGFSRLKSHEQALLAVFAAQACGDKKGAMAAITAMALSAAENHKKMPDFSTIKPLLKYIDDPRVQKVISRHAYVYTVLAAMLEFARTTGVLPPPYIIWLKPRDRSLWYILDCVGRQVAFVEVAGIFGHWKAEQTALHKLESPFVSKAVDGLERALGEVKIVVE